MISKAMKRIFDYYSKGIIVDSNLLLLLLAGIYDKSFIKGFKRTRKYSLEDFNLLFNFVGKFKTIYITPHILTEISNLSINNQSDRRFHKYINSLIQSLRLFDEKIIGKDDILKDDYFRILGATDVALMLASKQQECFLITDDLPLRIL